MIGFVVTVCTSPYALIYTRESWLVETEHILAIVGSKSFIMQLILIIGQSNDGLSFGGSVRVVSPITSVKVSIVKTTSLNPATQICLLA